MRSPKVVPCRLQPMTGPGFRHAPSSRIRWCVCQFHASIFQLHQEAGFLAHMDALRLPRCFFSGWVRLRLGAASQYSKSPGPVMCGACFKVRNGAARHIQMGAGRKTVMTGGWGGGAPPTQDCVDGRLSQGFAGDLPEALFMRP